MGKKGFPAHAGMDPTRPSSSTSHPGLPRTRGDGPRLAGAADELNLASPHTRGWTPGRRGRTTGSNGFPAHAGMDPQSSRIPRTGRRLPRTRGDGPDEGGDVRGDLRASPHTRGWTPRGGSARARPVGFPAHAGMDRYVHRGDVHRGRLPRTRGDGPVPIQHSLGDPLASPHTRGWTADREAAVRAAQGFPAHAGMDPLTVEAA